MFVNKINGLSQDIGFGSVRHVVNSVGETIDEFNYGYDFENEDCEIRIYKATPNDKYNYKIDEKPLVIIPIKPEGTRVSIQNITNLDSDEPYAYEVVRKNKKTGEIIWRGPDTGVNIREQNGEYVFRVHNGNLWKNAKYNDITPDGKVKTDAGGNPVTREYGYLSEKLDGPDNYKYTLVTRKGTTPLVQGIGYLGMPDSLMPAMKYRTFNDINTGEIWEDINHQKKMEGVIKTSSNSYGGSMAGLEAIVPTLKEMGVKLFFTTPFANGDNVNSHRYTNKNNFQIAADIGNLENFRSLIKKEYQNGIAHVYDATLAAEGLEGIHFQYALKWGEDAQSFNWFKINGIKNSNIGFGIIPNNSANLRHRIINPPYLYEQKSDGTYEKKVNPNYDENSETLIQLYDGSQITKDEISKLDESVRTYTNLTSGKKLEVNTSDDTVTNYIFQISPEEYDKRIDAINELNKTGKKINLDSSEGTILAAQFSNFRIDRKPGNGFVAWDANADLVKYNYGISGYDDLENQSIAKRSQRQYIREKRITGSKEVQDMACQTGAYWTELVSDIQLLYTAQTIGKINTIQGIEKLIADGKLPEETRVNEVTLKNILNRQYNLAPKGYMAKDDVTIKAIMKLPIESLEFGENVQGVLATSYFTNRATTDETIGKSRFELLKLNNPHLKNEYAGVYNRVNKMYTEELKNFADNVIKKINENSAVKLLDNSGNYTEFGEYVIDLMGREIARYAFLKSLGAKNFLLKQLPNGEITYDYDTLRKNTTLKKLGINGVSPENEASILQRKMEAGLKELNSDDINTVASSITKQIAGLNTNSFRLGEALSARAGLGLNHRIDANKDLVDIDSVRNRYDDVDEAWNNLIKITNNYVSAVKSKNPHAYTFSEMTDVADIFRDTYGGPGSDPYNNQTNVAAKRFNGEPDAMTKFFNETGIVSEAAYAYFFTELLNTFSQDFEKGTEKCDTHDDFKHKMDLLIKTRSADYLRNLYTFAGNHDKARVIHGLALDMNLFHSKLTYFGCDENAFKYNRDNRLKVAQVLSGANTQNDIPLELRLNIDNLDYFRTVSTRAVAQSKLLMESVCEDLKDILNQDDINLIKEALIDLANGNYLTNKETEKMTRINIKELSSIENAVNYIASKVGLTEKDKAELISKINSLDLNEFLVHGDFDYGDGIGEQNKKYLKEILGTDTNAMNYSLYTVQIARIIKKAAEGTPIQELINNSLNEFIQKFNRQVVNENSRKPKLFESSIIGYKKNAYAARDFKEAISLAIEQAEFKSGRKIQNKEQIINKVYQSVTEPAVQKHKMILSYLSALCGIPTLYAGDEYGMTGYEDKSKNIWLQNRGIIPYSEINDNNNPLGKLRRLYKSQTIDALRAKMNPELAVLRNGTPYNMDIISNNKTREEYKARLNEIKAILPHLAEGKLKNDLTKEIEFINSELAKVCYMTQSSDGDIAVSVFYAGGIDHGNRVNYFKKLGIERPEDRKKFFNENKIDTTNPENPYVPIQKRTDIDALMLTAGISLPIGTLFYNTNGKDKVQYIVKKVGDGLGIVRKDGKKIVLDGISSKNGVMILKKLSFKGSPNRIYNKTFNIPQYSGTVSNNITGQKFSVIAE